MADVQQQAVRECVARCKARGEDSFQACEALCHEFPDVEVAVLEEAIASEYGELSPEAWAKILAVKVPVEDAAVRLRARFPELEAARMASALKGAYILPPLTPDRLARALAAARYMPVEAIPAVKEQFSAVSRFEMLLLLHRAYPQIDREQVRQSMAAAEYSRAPEWIALDRMNTGADQLGLGVIADHLYAVGGQRGTARNFMQSYNLDKQGWSYCTPMPTARRQLCVGVINGKLYAIGGTDGTGGEVALAVNEEYDPQTDSWTRKTPPPVPTIAAAAAVVGGKLYVIGGYGAQTSRPQMFEYDPAVDSWTPKAPPIMSWPFWIAGVIDGRIHVLNAARGSMASAMHMIYDPATDTWQMKQELPGEEGDRTNFAAGVVDGKLYILGGERYIREDPFSPGKTVELDTCLVYDPASDAWSPTLSLSQPRSGIAAVAMAELGLLFVVGGREDMLALIVG